MMKAGILEEMIEDTMEGLEGEGEEEEEEEAAQAEIDRIMFELTAGALGTAPDALKGEFYNYRTGTELQ
jgi:charged multivesicular body protein 3